MHPRMTPENKILNKIKKYEVLDRPFIQRLTCVQETPGAGPTAR
jgi:hypothetical protein